MSYIRLLPLPISTPFIRFPPWNSTYSIDKTIKFLRNIQTQRNLWKRTNYKVHVYIRLVTTCFQTRKGHALHGETAGKMPTCTAIIKKDTGEISGVVNGENDVHVSHFNILLPCFVFFFLLTPAFNGCNLQKGLFGQLHGENKAGLLAWDMWGAMSFLKW